ncbi:unnamed protein product [Victoria cruziana]
MRCRYSEVEFSGHLRPIFHVGIWCWVVLTIEHHLRLEKQVQMVPNEGSKDDQFHVHEGNKNDPASPGKFR